MSRDDNESVLASLRRRRHANYALNAGVESLVGAFAMALLSRDLLQPLRGMPERAGLASRCVITAYTIAMHAYAGVMTAWGVLEGMRGRDSSFVRTPKKGEAPAVELPSPGTGG